MYSSLTRNSNLTGHPAIVDTKFDSSTSKSSLPKRTTEIRTYPQIDCYNKTSYTNDIQVSRK